jgi:hypothetical protein
MVMTALKLEPEATGLDYSTLLRAAAANPLTANQLEHLEIRIPQENVLLDLDGPPIRLTRQAIDSILAATTNLQTFCLQIEECCDVFTRDVFDGGKALAALGTMDQLVALRLTHPIFDTVETPTERVLNPNLRELSLSFMQFGQQTRTSSRRDCKVLVKAISKLTNLVKLSLSDCYLRDEDLDELFSALPNLRSLDLSGGFGDGRSNTEWISDRGVLKFHSTAPSLRL